LGVYRGVEVPVRHGDRFDPRGSEPVTGHQAKPVGFSAALALGLFPLLLIRLAAASSLRLFRGSLWQLYNCQL